MGNFHKIKYCLVFNRKGQLNQYGEALIQIRAYQKGKNPRFFSTGVYVEPKYWDDRNKCVSNTHPNEHVYYQTITAQLQAMKAFENKMFNRYGRFSLDRLHEYDQGETRATDESFTSFFERELHGHTMKPISKKAYKQTLNKLRAFRKTVYFEDLEFRLINDFDQFLHRSKLDLNTIKKHHMRMQTFIGLAIKQDLIKIDHNPYKKFSPKGKEPTRVSLTEDELKRIESLTFASEERHLERVRDIFLFQTYCLMRYEDVANVAPKDISFTSKGLLLTYKAEKTGKLATLPLYAIFRSGEQESRPEMIIQRYLSELGELASIQPDVKLFSITNQYYNRQLKEIAKRAGIPKNVTSHSARRTGASILHRRGMPFKAVQKLMQHSSPTMTNIYIHLDQQEIENELDKLLWK